MMVLLRVALRKGAICLFMGDITIYIYSFPLSVVIISYYGKLETVFHLRVPSEFGVKAGQERNLFTQLICTYIHNIIDFEISQVR